MAKFFLNTQYIYDDIFLEGHKLYKTLVFFKEFDTITGKSDQKSRLIQIIHKIEEMNNMKEHFVYYNYYIQYGKKFDTLVLYHNFFPTLDLYCFKNGFNKNELEQLVIDLCKTLECVPYYGNMTFGNIYVHKGRFYLSDLGFRNILLHRDDELVSKKDDLNYLVNIIYQMALKNQNKMIISSPFFKRKYETPSELKKSFFKYMNYDFKLEKYQIFY